MIDWFLLRVLFLYYYNIFIGICDFLESLKCEGKNEWLKCFSFFDKCNYVIKELGNLKEINI